MKFEFLFYLLRKSMKMISEQTEKVPIFKQTGHHFLKKYFQIKGIKISI